MFIEVGTQREFRCRRVKYAPLMLKPHGRSPLVLQFGMRQCCHAGERGGIAGEGLAHPHIQHIKRHLFTRRPGVERSWKGPYASFDGQFREGARVPDLRVEDRREGPRWPAQAACRTP